MVFLNNGSLNNRKVMVSLYYLMRNNKQIIIVMKKETYNCLSTFLSQEMSEQFHDLYVGVREYILKQEGNIKDWPINEYKAKVAFFQEIVAVDPSFVDCFLDGLNQGISNVIKLSGGSPRDRAKTTDRMSKDKDRFEEV